MNSKFGAGVGQTLARLHHARPVSQKAQRGRGACRAACVASVRVTLTIALRRVLSSLSEGALRTRLRISLILTRFSSTSGPESPVRIARKALVDRESRIADGVLIAGIIRQNLVAAGTYFIHACASRQSADRQSQCDNLQHGVLRTALEPFEVAHRCHHVRGGDGAQAEHQMHSGSGLTRCIHLATVLACSQSTRPKSSSRGSTP